MDRVVGRVDMRGGEWEVNGWTGWDEDGRRVDRTVGRVDTGDRGFRRVERGVGKVDMGVEGEVDGWFRWLWGLDMEGEGGRRVTRRCGGPRRWSSSRTVSSQVTRHYRYSTQHGPSPVGETTRDPTDG